MDYLEDDISAIYGQQVAAPIKARPKVEVELKTPDGRGSVQKGLRRTTAGTPKGVYSSPAVYTDVTLSESGNYGGRSGKGDVVFRYNCADSSSWSNAKEDGGAATWEVELFKSPDNVHGFLKEDARFMFQKTRDMASVMNRSVHELAVSIIDENDLDGYQDLRESTTEESVYVGRIRGDGKLTAGSVYFEGTFESSEGRVVSLDLSTLEECFLFPGQVVALGGTNNLGKCVVVKSVYTPRPLPFPEMPLKINRNTGPLNILIAAGPFTPYDSLRFEAFDDLLAQIKETRPGLCILLGPFLEESHPKLDEFVEKQENTFEVFFRKKVDELCSLSTNLGLSTKFVIVANSREVHHLPVFPTPPYSLNNDESSIIKIDKEVVVSVPDPSTISVGGVVIGLTSTDVLMHMQKSLLTHATIHTDRFTRIAREMLSQRSFYPLYPPNDSVPLDISLWTKFAGMECTPHVLVLPSELNHFIKDVDKTVVVNPGRLSSGKRTFARLQIDVPESSADVMSVADITMGEIVKI